MISNQQHEPPAPTALIMHPRIFLRMKLIAAARARDTLVVELDKLISNLDRMSQFDDRFSIQSVTMRELRDQVAFADIQNLETLIFMEQINQILAGIIAKLIAYDPQQASSKV